MLLSIWDIGKESMNVILESRGESRIYMDILEADEKTPMEKKFQSCSRNKIGEDVNKKGMPQVRILIVSSHFNFNKRKLITDFLYLICSVYSYNYQL